MPIPIVCPCFPISKFDRFGFCVGSCVSRLFLLVMQVCVSADCCKVSLNTVRATHFIPGITGDDCPRIPEVHQRNQLSNQTPGTGSHPTIVLWKTAKMTQRGPAGNSDADARHLVIFLVSFLSHMSVILSSFLAFSNTPPARNSTRVIFLFYVFRLCLKHFPTSFFPFSCDRC